MFWNKIKNGNDRGANTMDPDSYAKLLNRITERDADLTAIKIKVAVLEADMVSLRGKMSSKLRDLQKDFEKDKDEKDLNDELVPFG